MCDWIKFAIAFFHLVVCFHGACARHVTDYGWSDWAEWSECSRECGGGASYQTRKCPDGSVCHGDAIQYKTCNNQACRTSGEDFRSQQCAAYNDVPYHSVLYQWEAYYESRDPCSLRCRARDIGFVVMLAPKVLDGTPCQADPKGMCINGQCRSVGCDDRLESGAVVDRCGVCGGDGRSCSPRDYSARDYGPHRRPLSPAAYTWRLGHYTPCSVTCGVGVQVTSVECWDAQSNRIVPSRLCDVTNKPTPDRQECRLQECGPVWLIGEWQNCTKSCGGGISRRHLHCIAELSNGGFRSLPERFCQDGRPHTEKPCNSHPCPKWVAGQWSPCSVTCGVGRQYRDVICRRGQADACPHDDKPDTVTGCDTHVPCIGQKASSELHEALPKFIMVNDSTKITNNQKAESRMGPISRDTGTQPHPGLESRDQKATNEQPSLVSWNLTGTHAEFDEVREVSLETDMDDHKNETSEDTEKSGEEDYEEYEHILQHGARPYYLTGNEVLDTDGGVQKSVSFLDNDDELPSADEVPFGVHVYEAANRDQPYYLRHAAESEVYGPYDAVYDAPQRSWQPDGIQEPSPQNSNDLTVSTTPSFVAGEWGSCSVTCGHGKRRRPIVCKVYLEFSRTIQDLPDDSCLDVKPASVEKCEEKKCPTTDLSHRVKPTEDSYVWRNAGFSTCTASCHGGSQYMQYVCVRVSGDNIVEDRHCTDLPRPVKQARSCNTQSCPARWHFTVFGPCSVSCGGGVQIREVNCVVDTEADSYVVVALSECPQPIPPMTKSCLQVDCPPDWINTDWSPCSPDCGEGVQYRHVHCQQVVYPAGVLAMPESFCPDPKPPSTRPCENDKPCATTAVPPPSSGTDNSDVIIKTDTTTFVQTRRIRKVSVRVGGKVVVITGTRLAVRCPARNKKMTTVRWMFGRQEVNSTGRVKVTRHGALSIRKVKDVDVGVYTCMIGGKIASTEVNTHTFEEAQREYMWRQRLMAETERNSKHNMDPFYRDSDMLATEGYNRPTLRSLMDGNSTDHVMFMTSEWSLCSRTCGGAGLQMRNVTCESMSRDHYRVWPDSRCEGEGLVRPLETRDCGFGDCPFWQTSEFTQCSSQYCVRNWVGSRRRRVYCVMPDYNEVDDSFCDVAERPDAVLDCRSVDCIATWTVSNWTSCSRTCGDRGFETRVLRCTWESSGGPAGSECNGLARPTVFRPCQAPPCDNTGCQDQSRYCDLAEKLRLCRYRHYRQDCCQTCSRISRRLNENT